jgi:Fe-S-cluster containining protein
MASTYDCRKCGACCASYWQGDAYVRLYEVDLEMLRGTSLPIIEQQYGEGDDTELVPKLGTKVDAEGQRVCVAFEGEVGQACGCGIYDLRPVACRMFEAGSVLCREARQKRGLPV